MTELRKIETRPGLVFDALVNGVADAPLMLLIYAFAESLKMWRSMVALIVIVSVSRDLMCASS